MTHLDTLGRSTFLNIAPQADVKPTAREIRWFKHIERHGPQSSQYLFELTRDTHRCKDTALRQMQKLRAGGYLNLPGQQRATERAEFNPYIYDLSKKAKAHLFDLGLVEPTVRPTGHWWHGYATSCVTSSIDIAATRAGVRYIPAHEILAIKGASLAIPIGHQRLIPDQLFALDYGSSFRVFALEVDRGTEPKTSTVARKSWASSIDLYRQLIEGNIYKTHYGLKSNLLVLWVFSTPSHQRLFLKMIADRAGRAGASILAQNIGSPQNVSAHGSALDALFTRAWERIQGPRVTIRSGHGRCPDRPPSK